MARRHNNGDIDGVEKPTSGPLSLSGYITLQSNRNRKNNKNWRALQPSDLGTVENPEAGKAASSPEPSEPSEPDSTRKPAFHSGGLLLQSSLRGMQPKIAPATIPRLQTGILLREDLIPINTMRSAPQQVCSRSNSPYIPIADCFCF